MSRWRRKPVVIEAWQFMPAAQREALPGWIDRRWFHDDGEVASDPAAKSPRTPHMLIPTSGGVLRADITDWIIRGVTGDVYPCKAVVFDASFEPLP
jgi:hypothetical protein